MRRFLLPLLFAGLCIDQSVGDTPVQFARDVRPIFTQNCTGCHGGVKQTADLSFVYRDSVLPPNGWVIEPGDVEASYLFDKITSDDPDQRMPPPEHGPALSTQQIETIRRWIEEGAQWQDHWAFVVPEAPAIPQVADDSWCGQQLDRFVLARLEREGLEPSLAAPRLQWLRRVTFDLTGLPPTADEAHVFLSDDRHDAYQRVVDRLLASARFGERWASVWMDLARYADSQGYEKDSLRTMWPYRDWLIRALNADMPFDQFTIRQLAGDLLPDATLDDLVATAFHRNTPTNSEGGTDDEEFRVVAALDRASTTWEAWQGVTFKCTQCHDHPYDPIRHEEYYRFVDYFNTSKDWDLREDLPVLPVPLDHGQFARARELDVKVARLRSDRVAETTSLADATAWQPLRIARADSTGLTELVVRQSGDGSDELWTEGTVSHNSTFTVELEFPAGAGRLAALRLDVLPRDPDKALHTPEVGFIVSHLRAQLLMPGETAQLNPPEETAAPSPQEQMPEDSEPPEDEQGAEEPAEEDSKEDPDGGNAKAAEKKAEAKKKAEEKKLPGEVLFDWALGDEADPFGEAQATLHPDKEGWGAKPRLTHPRWLVVVPKDPLEIPAGARLRLSIWQDDAPKDLSPMVMDRSRYGFSADPAWTRLVASEAFLARESEIAELLKRRGAIQSAELPVIAEQEEPFRRVTAVFRRGDWLDKTTPVSAAIPDIFARSLEEPPRDRLELARWLVSAENPLTARVAVNRFWEQLFGTGIVETLDDFGSSGQAPSNPELLDFLAVRFQTELGWSTKSLLRELVLSSTYRQDAATTAELSARDPGNRLLARGPRQRLSAEMVRDNGLAVSGLLVDRPFGPSVMPPQPEGIWRAARSNLKWKTAEGDDRYRRALYTYWRRSSPYPSMMIFDAPNRLVCSAQRDATNTPLQALAALNDPVAVEWAAGLAGRMIEQGGEQVRDQIACGYRLAVGTRPAEADLADLEDLYRSALSVYQDDAELAALLAPSAERAAMTLVANAILNLDAVLTK